MSGGKRVKLELVRRIENMLANHHVYFELIFPADLCVTYLMSVTMDK